MTKADLIEEVSRLAELTRKDSEVIVETIFDSVVRALRTGDKIEIRGFGSFRTRQRKPRVGRNPKTGDRVEVPPKKIPFFKPSKELKDMVNRDGEKPQADRRRSRLRRIACGQAGELEPLQFGSRVEGVALKPVAGRTSWRVVRTRIIRGLAAVRHFLSVNLPNSITLARIGCVPLLLWILSSAGLACGCMAGRSCWRRRYFCWLR